MNNSLPLRFGELTLALAGAKDRLRVAVAEELGRAAGNAIRDLLAAGHPLVHRSSYPSRNSWNDERRWDDPDPWEDDRSGYRDRYEYDDTDSDSDEIRPTGIPPAVAVGLGLWRWWLNRSGSWRGALTLGLAASATTLLGGPVIRALLATLAVAAELLTPSALVWDPRRDSR